MINIKHRLTGNVLFSSEEHDLSHADLSGDNLRYADLRGANLRYTNLRGANLRYANLSGANLRYTNLSGADLRDADLSDADLVSCSGNRNQIRSIFISEYYAITYTSEIMQIGCERHSFDDWWSFDDKRILEMDGKSGLKFWRYSKEHIQRTISLFPATVIEVEK